jgi:hypothetical protein
VKTVVVVGTHSMNESELVVAHGEKSEEIGDGEEHGEEHGDERSAERNEERNEEHNESRSQN